MFQRVGLLLQDWEVDCTTGEFGCGSGLGDLVQVSVRVLGARHKLRKSIERHRERA